MSSPKNSSVASPIRAADVSDVSVGAAVSFAIGFFTRNWHRLIAAAWLPLLLAAAILYFFLDGYLSGLERFQGAPDSKIAGVALAELAAGIFISLFLYSMVVVSIADLLGGRAPRWRWVHLRAQQQEWRLYAGYLKFSVGVVAIFAVLAGIAIFNGSLIPLWLFIPVGIACAFALYVRTAFLFPPLIISERGSIVRRAWHLSAPEAWRLALIVLLLSLPGALAETASEYLLRLAGATNGVPAGSLTDFAAAMRRMLPGFLAAMTVMSFFNLSLLTAGAIWVYRALSDEREHPSR